VPGIDIQAYGDSVMLASAPALLAAFPGARIDAVVSRQLWDLPDLLAGFDGSRRHVVIGLGTNGPESPSQITTALSALSPDTVVVLVNTYGPQRWRQESNDDLAAAAATRPHTCVADWQRAIAGKEDLLAGDGIHPGSAGGELYAEAVATALRRCR